MLNQGRSYNNSVKRDYYTCLGAVLGPFTGRKLRMADIDKLSLKSYWEVRY